MKWVESEKNHTVIRFQKQQYISYKTMYVIYLKKPSPRPFLNSHARASTRTMWRNCYQYTTIYRKTLKTWFMGYNGAVNNFYI